MADNFDAVNIIQNILGTSLSGASVYKDRAPRNVEVEYIVVNSNACNSLDVVNVAQVNVNIFVPHLHDGTVDRQTIRTIRAAAHTAITNAASPAGYYCRIDRVFSAPVPDAREGYDCFSLRYELTLNQ